MGIIEFGEENFRGTGDKFKVHWEIGGKKKYKNYQISYLNLGLTTEVLLLDSPSSTVKMNTLTMIAMVAK